MNILLFADAKNIKNSNEFEYENNSSRKILIDNELSI